MFSFYISIYQFKRNYKLNFILGTNHKKMNFKHFFSVILMTFVMSTNAFFSPLSKTSFKIIDQKTDFLKNREKYDCVKVLSYDSRQFESVFHMSLSYAKEEKGMLVFHYKKHHDKLIKHIMEEFEDVYDFSNTYFHEEKNVFYMLQ